MKKNIIILLRFCLNFGFINGIYLYLKIRLGFVSSLKLPGIKYPFMLRSGTTDIQVLYEVFLYKNYDVDFTNPSVIIDAGANIGLFAIQIINNFPKAKIICIEPDIDNFKILLENTSKYKNIICLNSGLWNKDTKLNVYDKYNSGKWGMVVEEDKINGTVSAISMNTLIENYSIKKIDILKIDIETSEKELFMDNYENWLPKVKTVLIELHDWLKDDCSRSFFNAIDKSVLKYKYSIKGGTTIIVNNDIE